MAFLAFALEVEENDADGDDDGDDDGGDGGGDDGGDDDARVYPLRPDISKP